MLPSYSKVTGISTLGILLKYLAKMHVNFKQDNKKSLHQQDKYLGVQPQAYLSV
jgi:hypothetical protein